MLDLIGRARAFTIGTSLEPIPDSVGLSKVVNQLVTFIFWAAGILAVIYLIYGGILYITAGGDAEKATKGRTAVINAIIGIIIILLSIVIVAWVGKIVKTGSAN